MLTRPLFIRIWTKKSHYLTFFINGKDNHEYVIECAPAFDKGRIFDVTIRSRIRGVCLVTILINDLLLRFVIASDKSIMSHPAIFAVDIHFVYPFFSYHRETRGDHVLEKVNIAAVPDHRRHAWDIVCDVIL